MSVTMTEQRAMIEAAIHEAIDSLCQRFIPTGERPELLIVWDLKGKSCLGQAVSSGRFHRIRLHAEALERGGVDWYKATAVHEACHVVQMQLRFLTPFEQRNSPRFSAHGQVWRSMMRWLGQDPSRTGTLPEGVTLTPARRTTQYEVQCNCRTHVISAQRLRSLDKLQCRACRSSLTLVQEVAA